MNIFSFCAKKKQISHNKNAERYALFQVHDKLQRDLRIHLKLLSLGSKVTGTGQLKTTLLLYTGKEFFPYIEFGLKLIFLKIIYFCCLV